MKERNKTEIETAEGYFKENLVQTKITPRDEYRVDK